MTHGQHPGALTKLAPKTFELKSGHFEGNKICGLAAVCGNLDRGNDVIFPGAFKDAIAGFLADGFIADSHDWAKNIGYPLTAVEQDGGLYSEAEFHTTDDAQVIRTKCMERMAAGKSVGLSIGFLIAEDGLAWFKNGDALLAHAKAQGLDMAAFDTPRIKACKQTCRAITKIEELYEWSVVSVPMNPSANAADVKGETLSMPIQPSSASGTPLVNHAAAGAESSASAVSLLGLTLSSAGGKTTVKGDALGSIEADVSLTAVRAINSALMTALYRALYKPDKEVTTVEELLAGLPAAFDEARDLSLTVLSALLADVDLADLQDDLNYWYYYYSAPPGEQAALTFAHKAARLETDAGAFVTLASRRQEARVKEGRTLSQQTREKMTAIKEGLQAHCDALDALLTDSAPATGSETGDTPDPTAPTETEKGLPAVGRPGLTDGAGEGTLPAPQPPVVAAPEITPEEDVRRAAKRANADRLLREMQVLSSAW